MGNMIKCKGCNELISKKAKECPQCGEPRKKKTSFFTWLALVAFLMYMYNNTPASKEAAKKEKEETLRNLKADVKKIPASNFEDNYVTYNKLLELEPNNKKFIQKVAFYKVRYELQENISQKCRIKAREEIKMSLKHPNSYDVDTYVDKWKKGNYYYEEYFFASNSFGVKDRMVAQYICSPFKNKSGKINFNISRVFIKKSIQ